MIEFLVYQLNRLLYEPLYYCFWAGILLAVYFNWRSWKTSPLVQTITVGVAFFLLWRTLSGSVLASARYSAVVLYPALLLAIYAIAQVPKWLNRYGFLPKWNKYLQAALLIALFALCIGKDLRYNSYVTVPQKLAEVIRREGAADAMAWVEEPEFARLSYYAGPEAANLREYPIYLLNINKPIVEKVSQFIAEHRFDSGRRIFILREPGRQAALLPEFLVTDIKFDQVGSFYLNKRQREKFSVYVLVPSTVTASTTDDMQTVWLEDFSDVRHPGAGNVENKQFLADLNFDYYHNPAVRLPLQWSVSVPDFWTNEKCPQITLKKVDGQPQYLEFNTGTQRFNILGDKYFNNTDAAVLLTVSGQKNSILKLVLNRYDAEWQPLESMIVSYYALPHDGENLICFPVNAQLLQGAVFWQFAVGLEADTKLNIRQIEVKSRP